MLMGYYLIQDKRLLNPGLRLYWRKIIIFFQSHKDVSNKCGILCLGFPGSSAGKESAYNAGDPGSIAGLGRPLEKGETTHSSILGLP